MGRLAEDRDRVREAVRVEEGPAVFESGPGAASRLGGGVHRRLQPAGGFGRPDSAFREAQLEQDVESFLTLRRLCEGPAEILDGGGVGTAGQRPVGGDSQRTHDAGVAGRYDLE